eukprot:2908659-Prymnesium_polylepis.1
MPYPLTTADGSLAMRPDAAPQAPPHALLSACLATTACGVLTMRSGLAATVAVSTGLGIGESAPTRLRPALASPLPVEGLPTLPAVQICTSSPPSQWLLPPPPPPPASLTPSSIISLSSRCSPALSAPLRLPSPPLPAPIAAASLPSPPPLPTSPSWWLVLLPAPGHSRPVEALPLRLLATPRVSVPRPAAPPISPAPLLSAP